MSSQKPGRERHPSRDATSGSGCDLALYVHIPFCKQRCAYCHFDIKVPHPKTDVSGLVVRYREALEREFAAYGAQFQDRELGSIFLGGGTPSRLSPAALSRVLEGVAANFRLGTDVEISVEANPEDLTPAILTAWKTMGVNRVSVGVQTFHDPSLTAVRRPHDGASAYAVLADRPAFSKGFSMDLMLGLPYQNPATVWADLEKVEALELEHLSVYMLERDLPTPLDKLEAGMPLPDEDEQADAYLEVCQRLETLGYEHYEISNFAKPGFACKHNLVYWQCGDYLGLGPAAHGRVGMDYWANHPKFEVYCDAVGNQGNGRRTLSRWSEERLRQERLIQGLRLSKGVPWELFTGEERQRLEFALSAGLLHRGEQSCRLTAKGRLLANEVFMCLLPEAS